jgi:putative flavoprotein involved in K+ transport
MRPESMLAPHHSVAIVGGGQAGLSLSWHLRQRGIDHVVFEAKTAMHVWESRRWDSFSLVTPNWQCDLPGHPYDGPDPDGFMVKHEIIAYLAAFRRAVDAPLREGVRVDRVTREAEGRFRIETTAGTFTADHVVAASGGYTVPVVPPYAAAIPVRVRQLHSEEYRHPSALPDGAVLVVGTGQSGAQIAEDLHLAGRQVHLAVGNAPRCARFYRGRDVVAWLADMRYYEMPVDEHPLREGVRDNTNHYVTGRDGGRDIDLRRFAIEGMRLYGHLGSFADGALRFRPTLRASLEAADKVYNGINAAIDNFIAENGIDAPPPSRYEPVWEPAGEPTGLDLAAERIAAIVWCIGFRPDFGWLDAAVFDASGNPQHRRGVTEVDGVYFLGLPWLHTWGSGRFSAVGRDAAFLAERITAALEAAETPPRRAAVHG